MKNKLLYIITVFLSCVLLSSCSNSTNDIIGYWMDGNGNTLSFSDEENCAVNGSGYQYKIYDDNHIQLIDPLKNVNELVFKIDSGYLYIKNVESEDYAKYTKNEDEQKEIINRIKEAKAAAEEEAEKQEQIDSIQSKIDKYNRLINDANRRIEINEDDIESWKEDIQDAIDTCEEYRADGYEMEEYEWQRDEMIDVYNEQIKSCEDNIAEINAEIAEYENEIEKLNEELKILEDSVE